MAGKRNDQDDAFGYLEINLGKAHIKLSGLKGLLIIAAACFAGSMLYSAVTGGFSDKPAPQPPMTQGPH